MKKYVAIISGVALAIASLTAGAETIKVAHFSTQASSTAKTDEYFADLVSKATNGKTKLQFFWSGSLGAGNEIVHLIRDGAIQLGTSAPAYYASEMPIAGLTNGLPFVFKDVAVAMDLQDHLSRTNAHAVAEYKRVGVFPIVQHGLTPSHLMCTKPVEKFADLEGLKVRSFGFFLPIALQSLGMVAVSMPLTDTYEGLQRGSIDCVAVSYATAGAYKFHEVAKHWSDVNFGASSGPAMYASYKNYKEGGWSKDFIAIVDAAAKKAEAKEKVDVVRLDDDFLAKAIAGGAKLVKFPDQKKVDQTVPDMLKVWRDKQVKDGMSVATADELVAAVRGAIAGK